MVFQCKVIRENVLRFKRVKNTIINGTAMNIPVILHKVNIISNIIYLIILIIHALFLDLFIKVHVII